MDPFEGAGLVMDGAPPAAPAPVLNGDAAPPSEAAVNKIREWEQEHEASLEESARVEMEKKKALRETAHSQLNQWHEEEDMRLEKKKELNRMTEKEFLKLQAEQHTQGKSWDRVTSLIEKASLPSDGKDLTRMKKLLWSLKKTPPSATDA
jgi:hypothetical protein